MTGGETKEEEERGGEVVPFAICKEYAFVSDRMDGRSEGVDIPALRLFRLRQHLGA